MANQNNYQKGKDGREIALEAREEIGARLFSPSAQRNKDVIRDIFLKAMPSAGNILEIGSGSGEHAIHIAPSLPQLNWYGGDPDKASRESLAAWINHLSAENMQEPHDIDVTKTHWGETIEGTSFTGMISANMVHIAPFEAAIGLFAGADRLLGPSGKLFLYGPFSRNGAHMAASNADFDRSLKSRDPLWGVRDLENDILPLAEKANLVLGEAIDMPANNMAVIFHKKNH